jgi:penicillin-binding protein 1A
MILDVGVDNAAALAKRLGITSDVPDYPSIVLGTSSVSVLDMASVYSTFADNGEHVDPVVVSRVTDAKGTVLYEAPNSRQRVLSEDVAQGVNWFEPGDRERHGHGRVRPARGRHRYHRRVP